MKIGIIGGGAAGFFAAIHAKENYPDAQVSIFEKSKRVLSKVKISGGGRCNVTNGCTSISQLAKAYPRGEKALKKAFHTFNTAHTMEWFESRGVKLMTQEDGCVFPVSQNSQTIIDCFLNETRRLDVAVFTQHLVKQLTTDNERFTIYFKEQAPLGFDKIIVATGGSPKMQGLKWLEELGHTIATPVPSLFTFNMPNETITSLMGIVVEPALVSIQGTKLKSTGALLLTHWGMSGPAILKLSAFGARILSEKNYTFSVQVNWVNETKQNLVLETIQDICEKQPKKILANYRPYLLPERLWHYLIERCDLDPHKRWQELGKKGCHKITNILTHDVYQVQGKTTFKEEFVTCGGVSLSSIDIKTMQSRVVPHLYFAGEVLDIDGITGGYNFQAAWTTGFIAGQLGG